MDRADKGFTGYQLIDASARQNPVEWAKKAIDLQARALWSALSQDHEIRYVNQPPTYTLSSQRIRTPSVVLTERPRDLHRPCRPPGGMSGVRGPLPGALPTAGPRNGRLLANPFGPRPFRDLRTGGEHSPPRPTTSPVARRPGATAQAGRSTDRTPPPSAK